MSFRFLLSLLFIATVACAEKEKKENTEVEENEEEENGAAVSKRDGGLTAAIIGGAIAAGASFASTGASAAMQTQFNVATKGTIENYSKWSLRLSRTGCKILSGKVTTPQVSVDHGYKETFASHKTGNTATGTWMFCPFEVNKKYRVMYMYSVPYSQDFHANTLAVAICKLEKENCKRIDGPGMYYMDLQRAELDNRALKSLPEDAEPDYSPIAIDRHDYYYNIRNVKTCLEDLCIRGTMGSSHHPEIHLSVMPTTFNGLASSVASQSKKEQWKAEDYKEYVENLK